MSFAAVCMLVASCAPAAAALVQPEPPPAPSPAPRAKAKLVRASRLDLAAAYLRLERTLARVSLTPEQTADINRRFDQASIAFFSGQYAGAVRTLSEIVREREGRALSPGLAVAECVQVKPSHAVFHPGNAESSLIAIEPMFIPASDRTEASVDLVLALLDAKSRPVWTTGVTLAMAGGAPLAVRLAVSDYFPQWPRGDFTLALQTGEVTIEKCRVTIADRSMDEARKTLLGRLAAVPVDAPAQVVRAAAVAASRAECLGDEFDAKSSRRFLASQLALDTLVSAEVDAVLAGKNPYRHLSGDHWRTFGGAGGVPCRVYAPEAALKASAPLVVAFHGAGGDESMFFEGYGAGAIKTLADKHGCIVVCPQTERASSAGAFDKVLEDIAADYEIDPKRTYILGHSMGASAVASLAAARGGKVAAACCIAGSAWSKPATTGRLAPTLTIAAELDPLFGIARARKAAESIKPPDEFIEIKGYGHTLVVGSQLQRAIEWLLARSLDEPAAR